jgi:hypothetical protein
MENWGNDAIERFRGYRLSSCSHARQDAREPAAVQASRLRTCELHASHRTILPNRQHPNFSPLPFSVAASPNSI